VITVAKGRVAMAFRARLVVVRAGRGVIVVVMRLVALIVVLMAGVVRM
jgi:hypothetical protein